MKNLVLILVLFVAGCGPSLSERLSVPEIQVPQSTQAGLPPKNQTAIDLVDVKDGRLSTAVVFMENKSVEPLGSVTTSLRNALLQAVSQEGFQVKAGAPLRVNAEIRSWSVRVERSLASTGKAEAKFFVEVFDPSDKKIYAGNYEGYSSMQHPALDENDIRKALALAMGEAVKQFSEDRALTDLLGSF